ncbi:hypothetical protein RHECIAT_CH0003840 [Rhizobium etli CIAT 652]|uniref:Uncharacterized protein n=1 Tax=Rhizobium etli (strain CIAT 652) TaxID=491916 RepID=B3PZX7_RHIE6|nr:hypothetical protein RHECIAT_CH0003840 [Rhizobium etli CIAT 652]
MLPPSSPCRPLPRLPPRLRHFPAPPRVITLPASAPDWSSPLLCPGSFRTHGKKIKRQTTKAPRSRCRLPRSDHAHRSYLCASPDFAQITATARQDMRICSHARHLH